MEIDLDRRRISLSMKAAAETLGIDIAVEPLEGDKASDKADADVAAAEKIDEAADTTEAAATDAAAEKTDEAAAPAAEATEVESTADAEPAADAEKTEA